MTASETEAPEVAEPQPPRKGHRARWLVGGGVIVAAGAILAWTAFGSPSAAPVEEAAAAPNTATITRQDLSDTTTLSGTVEFDDPVTASSPSAGFVSAVATEGAVLQRGDLVALVSEDVTDSDVAAATQRVLSAQAGVDNSTNQYDNLTEAPSDADVAAAQVALTRAQDAYDALFDPPSDADMAAARAQLDRANDAYRALFAGPDDSEVAAAQLAVDQAQQKVDQAETGEALALVDLQSAQTAYCGMATVPVDVCGASDVPLSSTDRAALAGAASDFTTGGDLASAGTTRALLAADDGYANAVLALDGAQQSLADATDRLDSLGDGPTDAQRQQALADVYSAQDHLTALQSGPTDAQVAAAEADVLAAQDRLDTLQAGPSSLSVAAASSSLQNARLGLQQAQSDLASLLAGPRAVVLMYGDTASWRTLTAGVAPGPDVRQLEANLVALGFDADGAMVVDDAFDDATTAAIEAWQTSLGLDPSGTVEPGMVDYVTGPSQVTSQTVSVGDQVGPSQPMAELTPIERVLEDGTVASTQRIVSHVDVSDRDLLALGDTVTITLPDDSTVDATVSEIGEVAETQTAQNGSTSTTVQVVFVPSEPIDPVWTGADVDVDVVTSLTKDALTVPVSALLALREGGYAVEVVDADGSTHLVGVDTGAFNDGAVEITGDGLDAGMQVVVP